MIDDPQEQDTEEGTQCHNGHPTESQTNIEDDQASTAWHGEWMERAAKTMRRTHSSQEEASTTRRKYSWGELDPPEILAAVLYSHDDNALGLEGGGGGGWIFSECKNT